VIASICVRQALSGSKSGVAFDAPLRKFPPVIPEPWSTPPQLFREFESGRITRAQLHAALAWHARELIMEMVDDRLHPAAAWVEQALARRATARLLRRHSEQRLRAILAALSEVPGFPPARWLWNAPHAEVPLHCLLRIRREPVFRLRAITNHPGSVEVAVEYGSRRAHAATRERFTLEHSHHGTLRVAARQPEPRA
jgi:hypothetical protein